MLYQPLRVFFYVFFAVFTLPGVALSDPWSDVKTMSDQDLIVAVKKLDLGFENYKLGYTLTKDQLKIARKKSINKKYQGTLKFKDGDVGVVADSKSNNILALYIEEKEADKEKIKNMVATLMMTFGQPTTMAHDKIIYWAFNAFGLISEETHGQAKKADELNILATVKFNSKTRFMEEGADKEKNAIYCIVSSPQLLERFINK